MFLGSCDSDFSAILKDTRGNHLADGKACVSKEEHSITFTSDFVPLYPVGTLMEIDRIFQKNEIHRFQGSVYLSDKKLMRLVSVEDELLPGYEQAYCCGMQLSAKLTSIPGPVHIIKRLFTKAATSYPIQIYAFNEQQLEFRLPASFDELEEEQAFLIENTSTFPLPSVTVQIEKVMAFGSSSCYLCSYTDISPEHRTLLHDYLLKYGQEIAKLTN